MNEKEKAALEILEGFRGGAEKVMKAFKDCYCENHAVRMRVGFSLFSRMADFLIRSTGEEGPASKCLSGFRQRVGAVMEEYYQGCHDDHHSVTMIMTLGKISEILEILNKGKDQ